MEEAPEPMPGYEELVRRSYRRLAGALRGCSDCGWDLSRRTWAENAWLAWSEPLLCLVCTVGWTVAHQAASQCLFWEVVAAATSVDGFKRKLDKHMEQKSINGY